MTMTSPQLWIGVLGILHLIAGVLLLEFGFGIAGSICIGVSVATWLLIAFMIVYDAVQTRKA